MKASLPRVLAAGLLALPLFAATPAWADENEPDFKLVNMTGSLINGVFISLPGANAFTRNEMDAALPNGETKSLKYNGPAKQCVGDFLVGR